MNVLKIFLIHQKSRRSDDGWAGHKTNQSVKRDKSQAGVVEAFPGIIESTNIDPLNEDSNKGGICLVPRHRTRLISFVRRWLGKCHLGEKHRWNGEHGHDESNRSG